MNNPSQEAIRSRCFHPCGTFVEFTKEEVEQSIPSRFEKIASKHPDRIAVKTRNHALTYNELNASANRLARAILAQSEGKEERIAVLLEHDASLLTAILGLLKAGKSFVPLDPFFPWKRNRYILDDSEAGIIVTSKKALSLANALRQPRHVVINVDEIGAGSSVENLGLPVSPDESSYILYTSGSTGRPKGVFQNHRNVLHDIMQYTNTLHIQQTDRINLFYSCSLRSLRAILGALLNGAALFFFNVKEEGTTKLADWLIQEQITVYHSVPSVFRLFAGALTGKEKFPTLRVIRLGGERVLRGDVELYKKHFSPDCLLCIGMGTTETGTVRQYFIDKSTEVAGTVVPSGYAVADQMVLILNDVGADAGFDRVGEIAVKSRYLALGYWRNPHLTQSAFLPDSTGGDERLYLTGDLGRVSPDGCLFHLGRKDFQVKIRGYRIEPSEIEMVLLGHGTIKEAVVVAREGESGDKRLVAYIVARQQPAPTVSELRRFLQDKLPDYMLPSSFVFLHALPMTPNGKVDRNALPSPGGARPDLEEAFAAPRTPVEEALAKIWAEVLGLDQVGIHDHFLDIGGNSLLAGRIVSRVMECFGVELPANSLWQASTVAEMTAVLVQHQIGKVSGADLACVLKDLESLSDEEAGRLLTETIREKNGS